MSPMKHERAVAVRSPMPEVPHDREFLGHRFQADVAEAIAGEAFHNVTYFPGTVDEARAAVSQ